MNQSQFAVLGLLNLRPMSGYDIKQLIAWSIGHFWREGYGQIYPTLRKLQAAKMVTRRIERQKGKPDRNVYSITAKGRERLKTWLQARAGQETPRNELLLKLFLGRPAPVAMLAHVEEHRQKNVALLKTYEETRKRLDREKAGHPDKPYWLMTLSYGEHVSRGLVDWYEETLRELRKQGVEHA